MTWLLVSTSPDAEMTMPLPAARPRVVTVLMFTSPGMTAAATALASNDPFEREPPFARLDPLFDPLKPEPLGFEVLGVNGEVGKTGAACDERVSGCTATATSAPTPADASTSVIAAMSAATRLPVVIRGGWSAPAVPGCDVPGPPGAPGGIQPAPPPVPQPPLALPAVGGDGGHAGGAGGGQADGGWAGQLWGAGWVGAAGSTGTVGAVKSGAAVVPGAGGVVGVAGMAAVVPGRVGSTGAAWVSASHQARGGVGSGDGWRGSSGCSSRPSGGVAGVSSDSVIGAASPRFAAGPAGIRPSRTCSSAGLGINCGIAVGIPRLGRSRPGAAAAHGQSGSDTSKPRGVPHRLRNETSCGGRRGATAHRPVG